MMFQEPCTANGACGLSESVARRPQGLLAPLCQTLMFLLLFAGFGASSLLVASLIQVFE